MSFLSIDFQASEKGKSFQNLVCYELAQWNLLQEHLKNILIIKHLAIAIFNIINL